MSKQRQRAKFSTLQEAETFVARLATQGYKATIRKVALREEFVVIWRQ